LASIYSAAIIARVTLAACTTVGNRFDISKANALEPGVTTEADAKKLLGEPMSVHANADNNHELLVWQYASGNALGTGSASVLAVSFDENGRMLKIIQKSVI
jgi:outer membrane protein assembly factor BamE (lipoprotein component of BamABCDE complex)